MAHIKDLKPDKRNARRHTPRNVGMIERSLQTEGFGRSILLAADGTIIAGNATAEAAAAAGIEEMIVVESDGSKVIAVKRTDVEPGSERFHNLAISDNRAADLADWDADVLRGLADDGVDLSQFWFDDELDALLATIAEPPTLDELAAQYGEHDDATFWPELRLKIPPETMERYETLMRLIDGGSDAARFARLLEVVNIAALA